MAKKNENIHAEVCNYSSNYINYCDTWKQQSEVVHLDWPRALNVSS
jgi:hypothetical protein